MNNKFSILVSELEAAGAVEHQAYELANQIDKAVYALSTRKEISEIAKEIIQEDAAIVAYDNEE